MPSSGVLGIKVETKAISVRQAGAGTKLGKKCFYLQQIYADLENSLTSSLFNSLKTCFFLTLITLEALDSSDTEELEAEAKTFSLNLVMAAFS